MNEPPPGAIQSHKPRKKLRHDYNERKETSMDIMATIKDILAENLDIEADRVEIGSSFASLGIDSLDMVELICELEERCNIEFGEPEGLNTVGDLIAYVESL